MAVWRRWGNSEKGGKNGLGYCWVSWGFGVGQKRSFRCRPMGWDSFSMWDYEQDHIGWSGEVDGAVQVSTGVRECSVGKGVFWQEIWLKGYCLGSWGLGNGQDWPLGFMGVINQVLGLKV
uniref:Uncharacterized protein n=1 Tax=Tanacetum cinerariifolium TaxID=118510 RepID=A0A6L2P0N8_TANCI|nr:hypothetical protein [Tanacetum cinerariifolium]